MEKAAEQWVHHTATVCIYDDHEKVALQLILTLPKPSQRKIIKQMQFRVSNHIGLVVGALDELPVPVDFATE